MQTANITVKNKPEINNTLKRKHLKESLLQRKKKMTFVRPMDEKQEKGDFIPEMDSDLLNNSNESKQTTNESLHVLVKTIKSTMLQISERQERNRDRRHREHMTLLEKYLKRQAGENDVEKETKIQFEFGSDFEDVQDGTGTEETEFFYTELEAVVPQAVENKLHSDFQEQLKLPMTEDNFTEKESHLLQMIQSSVIPTQIKSSNAQIHEFKLMRDQMIEMQRKKMEDRERKNREKPFK